MNLGQVVQRSARYWPHAMAAMDKTKCLTHAELDAETDRLASGLVAAGFPVGSHIAMQAENCTQVLATEIACYKGGMVKVPINARLSPEETIHVVNDSHAVVIIAGSKHAADLAARRDQMPRLKMIVAISGDAGDTSYEQLLELGRTGIESQNPADSDLAVLHYTSGSSGVLKAAMQSYGNRRALLRKNLIRPGRDGGIGVIMGHVGPITHASGMSILPTLYMGGGNVLFDRFDIDEVLSTIEREKINRIFFVPTMVSRILASGLVPKYDLSSLKSVTYGAAPMAPSVVEEAMAVFGPILSQGYGAGETTSTVTVLTAEDHVAALAGDRSRLASCGRSYFENELRIEREDGTEADIGEAGEIVVRGPDVMLGYWNAPELTAEVLIDGAYHTGDVATRDEEGYVFIVDRKKDMIISGGFNVYPSEVEKVLYRHPAVFEVAVVGVPDKEWGEAVKAVVVTKSGIEITPDALADYCKENLPGFKRPRSFDFAKDLPRNPNGKIVRRQVRDAYWAASERKV
ncbi:AMP-binding protein [Martelella mediterranea]|uniref:AMP-binding protein n=1 Tax=Martelella mediterranea TaxID=293089 RepID=UPI001E3C3EF3|nr:AMP-binding protein [Martelella mediterranea]MCD1634930.1 AMP-binding protein [Martelella mediterranea]